MDKDYTLLRPRCRTGRSEIVIALNDEYQSMAANAICHAAAQAGYEWQVAAQCYAAPSAIWKPKLSIDGDQWCALYGDDLQSGVAGFGKSPQEAMWDFDRAWTQKLPSIAAQGVKS